MGASCHGECGKCPTEATSAPPPVSITGEPFHDPKTIIEGVDKWFISPEYAVHPTGYQDPQIKGKRFAVLGSGPSSGITAPLAIQASDMIACTNNSWQLAMIFADRVPDVYFASDAMIFPVLRDTVRWMYKHNTMILTLQGILAAMQSECGVKPYDIILQPAKQSGKPWIPGHYTHCHTSGGMLTQWLINNGASEVHLAGFDGYQSGPYTRTIDTFDHRIGDPKGEALTSGFHGPFIRSLAENVIDTEVYFYGTPHYALSEGPHFHHVTGPAAPETTKDV